MPVNFRNNPKQRDLIFFNAIDGNSLWEYSLDKPSRWGVTALKVFGVNRAIIGYSVHKNDNVDNKATPAFTILDTSSKYFYTDFSESNQNFLYLVDQIVQLPNLNDPGKSVFFAVAAPYKIGST